MYAAIIVGLWALWTVYWVVAARDAKATRRQEPTRARLVYTAPLLLCLLLLGTGRIWPAFLDDRFVPSTPAGETLSVLIVAAGLGFAAWARRHIGRNWSGTVTLKQDHELIRSGPYGRVRHPIYTGLLLGFLGTALAVGEWRGVLALALVTGSFLYKLRIEERWMTETFPADYPRYRAETWALLPFLF
jgi:protein-S-isoprenylcysteine O-methyltransferase Ste14